jgi:hypothetical protein
VEIITPSPWHGGNNYSHAVEIITGKAIQKKKLRKLNLIQKKMIMTDSET